jgi:hypothetical protein
VGFRLSARWAASVLAVLVALVVVFGGTSWGRHQAALSLTRLPDAIVEMYVQDPSAAASCPRGGESGVLTFVLANRSPDQVQVSWEAAVTASGSTPRRVAGGVAELPASSVRAIGVVYQAPSGRFAVDVRDTTRGLHLLVNCPPPAPA